MGACDARPAAAGDAARAHGPDGPAAPAEAGDVEAVFAFRALRAADLPEVLAIERRVFRTPWDEPAFRAFLRSGPAFSWIALAGGRVVGYALGWCIPPQAELMNLAVDPRWQGRSVGAALLRRTFATCARRGARDLFLDVRVSNERAQRLYRRHGFELFSRRRNYYRNPREDALMLRARVPPGRPGCARRRGARPERTPRSSENAEREPPP